MICLFQQLSAQHLEVLKILHTHVAVEIFLKVDIIVSKYMSNNYLNYSHKSLLKQEGSGDLFGVAQRVNDY